MTSLKSAIPLHRTCHEATHLMLEAQDKPLTLWNSFALQIHLWICANCPRFQLQLQVMQRALSDWRNEFKK